MCIKIDGLPSFYSKHNRTAAAANRTSLKLENRFLANACSVFTLTFEFRVILVSLTDEAHILTFSELVRGARIAAVNTIKHTLKQSETFSFSFSSLAMQCGGGRKGGWDLKFFCSVSSVVWVVSEAQRNALSLSLLLWTWILLSHSISSWKFSLHLSHLVCVCICRKHEKLIMTTCRIGC